jgi:hypothetical protein
VFIHNLTPNDPMGNDKEDAWDACHGQCEHHLGKDSCDQGFSYTNCMKACMAKKGFGYP